MSRHFPPIARIPMIKKNGFTLLEVTLGMIALAAAAVSMQMLMPKRESQSLQAVTESRKITTALRMARQIAIAKQTQVRLRFLGNLRRATGLVVENLVNGAYIPVMQESTAATVSSAAIVFSPTGSADSAFRASVGTGDQIRHIDVIAGSGMVRRDEP